MKNLLKTAAVVVAGLVLPMALSAQEIIISNFGNYTGCGATIVDTGAGPGPYSPNENITFTICPEAPETVITLDFVIFNLGEGDFMNIHQGPDDSFPLEGTFEGFDLSGGTITSQDQDPSGCITVQFISDGSDEGNFAFVVSCGPPCERPEAIVDAGGPTPIRACVGDEITFDGTGSIFADGTALQSFNWTFGDGETDNTTGLVVTHSYDEPGEYRVQLFLVDDNDCNSINLPDVQVLIGTEPSFEGSDETLDICLGQEVDLTGIVTGTLWNGQPENPIGGYLEIPDDQTQCFSSEILFQNFTPGQTVTGPSDFESVFVNMEHSFMGDLVITLICPNGQQLILHEQGGGGTFLGIPNDPDIGMEIQPGTGFDYWWAPDATSGTWAAEGASVSTLPSGTYAAVQPWDAMIGCPLNGAWTLQICDLWGADNGVVFDWTVTFNPSLYPDLTTFTPQYGAGCDSTFWADGPFITNTSPDCNEISVLPTDVGSFNYTFTATDNHGCTYEHTATVNVEQGPLANIVNDDLSFCGDPITLSASVSNPSPGANYIYEWSPSSGLSNPNSANPTLSALSADQYFTVFVYEPGEEECGSIDSVFVEFVPPVFTEQSPVICGNEDFTLPSGIVVAETGVYVDTIPSIVTGCDSVVTTNLLVNPVYDLTTEVGLCGSEEATLPDGSTVSEPGVYPVTLISSTGCDSTIVTTVTVVTVDAGEYPPTCSGQFVVQLEGSSSPENPEATLTWSGPSGISFNDPESPITIATAESGGSYTLSLTDSRCPNAPATTTVVMRTPPDAEFGPFPELCVQESRPLQVALTGDYGSPITWIDIEGIFADETGNTVTVNGESFIDFLPVENYEIQVLVPGLSPCPNTTATTVISVIDCEIEIPNIFTPNSDGMNDAFVISGIESFPGSRMTIYNRWGKVVYESDSYGAPFWDGTHYKSGVEVADGVYFYELVLSRLDMVEKGTVNISRTR